MSAISTTPVPAPRASRPAAAYSAASTAAAKRQPPMHLAFDVFLDLVKSEPQRDQLLNGLRGQLRKGDTIWLAVEGTSVAKNPALLDQLAAEQKKWRAVLGPEGVNVKTRIRFERIHTDRATSAQTGMQNLYDDVLKARLAKHEPVADSVSYDYESNYGFSGDEYTPHDTANAARLFAQGQHIAKALGASYFVEPSVTAYHPHPGALYTQGKFNVTLDWKALAPYTDGFNFQTQRINAGTSKGNVDAATRAADRADYGRTVGHLAEGLTKPARGKRDWVMAQLSTEWSNPATVVAAAANARAQAPDLKAYYIWWYDTGRSEPENVQHLLAMTRLWNKTFHRGEATRVAPSSSPSVPTDTTRSWWNPLSWL